ncbi:MAG: hypothetical protein JWM71_1113, partial [Solirubrobacteraceae bacterium]|nr:hypothetical protein [Solirubrobacteraceae bacterium]
MGPASGRLRGTGRRGVAAGVLAVLVGAAVPISAPGLPRVPPAGAMATVPVPVPVPVPATAT